MSRLFYNIACTMYIPESSRDTRHFHVSIIFLAFLRWPETIISFTLIHSFLSSHGWTRNSKLSIFSRNEVEKHVSDKSANLVVIVYKSKRKLNFQRYRKTHKRNNIPFILAFSGKLSGVARQTITQQNSSQWAPDCMSRHSCRFGKLLFLAEKSKNTRLKVSPKAVFCSPREEWFQLQPNSLERTLNSAFQSEFHQTSLPANCSTNEILTLLRLKTLDSLKLSIILLQDVVDQGETLWV